MRIYLIGFMGSGKSTLGHKASQVLSVPFFDTDIMIEEREGKSIAAILKEQGESHFRKLETIVLESTQQIPKAIIATGGGLPVFHQHMNWMLTHGITIYLEWPLEKLKSKLITGAASRPMLKDFAGAELEAKIEKLFIIRKPIYEQSAITIEMSGDEEEDYLKVEKACRYIW
jgi:shikimate kinase